MENVEREPDSDRLIEAAQLMDTSREKFEFWAREAADSEIDLNEADVAAVLTNLRNLSAGQVAVESLGKAYYRAEDGTVGLRVTQASYADFLKVG
jgi:hypothetical protein